MEGIASGWLTKGAPVKVRPVNWRPRPDSVMPKDPAFAERWNLLPERQQWVLRCRAQGNTNDECAMLGGVSSQTVKNQITEAFKRLQHERRIPLIAYLLGRYDALIEGE